MSSRQRDQPDPTQIIEGKRVRNPPNNIATGDLNASDDVAIKKLKAQAAQAQSTKKTTVEDVDDEHDDDRYNTPPRNPSRLLESDDDDGDDDYDEEQPRRASKSGKRAHISDSEDDEAAPSTSKAKRLRGDASGSTVVIDVGTPEPEPSKRKETAEEERDRLAKGWDVPIYAFFEPIPTINYTEKYDEKTKRIIKRRCHEFKCSARNCLSRGALQRVVRRYLDTDDKTSTSNLRKHASKCWGKKLVQDAEATKDLAGVRKGLGSTMMKDGRLTAVFERTGKGRVSYSHIPHTDQERRVECVRWVAEAMRPCTIVDDRAFHALMKTGRPNIRIPSSQTVACDVHFVFARVKERVAKMLQDYDGKLSFATDAWTSPNGKPYVAVTVHFEHEGKSICMLLDIVEVAEAHSGANLAAAFAKILADYQITNKACFPNLLSIVCDNASANDKMIDVLARIISLYGGSKNRVRCFAHIIKR